MGVLKRPFSMLMAICKEKKDQRSLLHYGLNQRNGSSLQIHMLHPPGLVSVSQTGLGWASEKNVGTCSGVILPQAVALRLPQVRCDLGCILLISLGFTLPCLRIWCQTYYLPPRALMRTDRNSPKKSRALFQAGCIVSTP